jgi:hypothetical protein
MISCVINSDEINCGVWSRARELGDLDGSVVASPNARDFVLFLLFYVSKAAGGGRESLYQ